MFKNAQIRNILWMFIDKAFLLVGGFVVSVMVARYLGPENLGFISYGIALGGLAIAFTQWGANYTIFNVAAKNEKLSILFISTTEKYRIYIYIIIFLIVNIWLYKFGGYTNDDFLLISLVFLSQVFLGLDIYQYHYNARLTSKINAISSMIAKVISMAMRLYFALNEMNIFYFVIPFFIEGAIILILRRNALLKIYTIKQKNYRNVFFQLGIPLVTTGVFVVIYTKINELMVGNIVSYEALGLYSVGLTLNYAWTFIPMSVGISLVSKVIQDIAIEDKIHGFAFVTVMSLLCGSPMLIMVYFYSTEILKYTFGIQYESIDSILFIQALGCLFGTLGFITNRVINSFPKGGQYLLFKVTLSSIFMIGLSYFLVEKYGIIGASISFMVAELLNLTLFNYFFHNCLIFKIHSKIFNSWLYYKSYM
jgi:O-antigen/teichoic acid export membrane protein